MTMAPHHIDAIKSILGPKGWKQGQEDLAPFMHEWRDRWHGHTPLVALPGDTETVAKLVTYCAQNRIAITPQGGNTGLVGGQIPQGELLLSTRRLSRIRALNVRNSTLTLEAGVTLAQARDAAHEAGLLLPISLASEGSATIGGILSTNAGGMEVLRYGTVRDLTLGLEVVTANGEVLSTLKGLRKDNTGYDLKQLFIGAEGTLGIVSAAVLKLFPLPPVRQSAWCALDSVDDAITLLGMARQHTGNALSKFELIPHIGVEYAIKNVPGNRATLDHPGPWYVLLELEFFKQGTGTDTLEALLDTAMQSGLVKNAVIAQSDTQAAQFLRLRESLSAAQKGEGLALKYDVSVPVSAMSHFIDEASTEVERIAPDCRIFAFGHVGDGNVHFDIVQPRAMAPETFSQKNDSITRAVYARVLALGGSISAEHGIGILKKSELCDQKSAVEMRLMRSIKSALDPDNIMNPRVLL